MKYLIVIEETATGYSAYSPDVPGCVATSRTRGGLDQEIRAAIEFHLRGLTEERLELPQARTAAAYVEVGDLDFGTSGFRGGPTT